VSGILDEAQKRYGSIWGGARASAATNPQSQMILDPLGKWRQGRYMLNLYDKEESISPGGPRDNLAVDHENNQMLSRSASQDTLVESFMTNPAKVTESPKYNEAEVQKSQIVSTEVRSNISGVLAPYEVLKLEEKGTQATFTEKEKAKLENVVESCERTVSLVEERRSAGLKVRRKAVLLTEHADSLRLERRRMPPYLKLSGWHGKRSKLGDSSKNFNCALFSDKGTDR
tara:strand:+ start:2464 stop:3150 length:687 start_codon:yes stop_codon:yes gene_type:complete